MDRKLFFGSRGRLVCCARLLTTGNLTRSIRNRRIGADFRVVARFSVKSVKIVSNRHFRFAIFLYLPLVAFKVLQLDAKRIVLCIGQHVNIFIAQPEFAIRIAESALVVVPVSVKVLSVVPSVVVPPLDHLKEEQQNKQTVLDVLI